MPDSVNFIPNKKTLFEQSDGEHWKGLLLDCIINTLPEDVMLITVLPNIAAEMRDAVQGAINAATDSGGKEQVLAGVHAARDFLANHFALKDSRYREEAQISFDLLDIAFRTDNIDRLQDGVRGLGGLRSKMHYWAKK